MRKTGKRAERDSARARERERVERGRAVCKGAYDAGECQHSEAAVLDLSKLEARPVYVCTCE
jgi:hypothetical protein